jgi:hypothetical protein
MVGSDYDQLRIKIQEAISARTQDAEAVVRAAHVVFTVGGSFIAGLAQFIPDKMDAPLAWLPSWQFGLGVGGVCLALVGALATFWLQRRSPEELQLASSAISAADAEKIRAADERAVALNYQIDLTELFDKLAQRDTRRGYTATAMLFILEAVDQIAAERGRRNIRRDVERLLDAGADPILKGLGLDKDRFCFSVFHRVGDGADSRMEMIAERRERSLRRGEAAARSWRKGEGFTGHAWLLGRVLQIKDTMTQEGRLACPADRGTSEDDRTNYRSVICVPIHPGRDDGEPWGMITVTSDQASRFGDAEQDGDVRANAVEAIAKALAIMVAARYLNQPPARR